MRADLSARDGVFFRLGCCARRQMQAKPRDVSPPASRIAPLIGSERNRLQATPDVRLARNPTRGIASSEGDTALVYKGRHRQLTRRKFR